MTLTLNGNTFTDIKNGMATLASGTDYTVRAVNSTPSSTSTLTSLEGPSNCADNYGERIQGYLYPAATGSYTFYIAGDDNIAVGWTGPGIAATTVIAGSYLSTN